MPDIKNQFTGGKMNKDVDERLVPKGEYRDAWNIQVSTSEASDVGTVQNILGNSRGCLAGQIPNTSFTVGSISDEKNDSLYWLVSGESYQPSEIVQQSNDWTRLNQMTDSIWRLTNSGCEPVFIDKFAYSQLNTNTSISDVLTGISPAAIEELEVGWTVTGVNSDGTTSNTATITSIAEGSSEFVEFEYVPGLAQTQTFNIGPNPNLQIGTNLLIPFNQVPGQSGQSATWAQSNGNVIYIQGFTGNVADLVGGIIDIMPYAIGGGEARTIVSATPYEITIPQQTIQQAPISTTGISGTTTSAGQTTNQSGDPGLTSIGTYTGLTTNQSGDPGLTGIGTSTTTGTNTGQTTNQSGDPGLTSAGIGTSTTSTASIVAGQVIDVVKITLDFALPTFPSPNEIIPPSGNGAIASVPYSSTYLVEDPSNPGSYIPEIVNAELTIDLSAPVNIATGELTITAPNFDYTSISVGDSVAFQGQGLFIRQINEPVGIGLGSIVLEDSNGNIHDGWQVGGFIFGQIQSTGGLIFLAGNLSINLNTDLDLSSGYESLLFSGPRTLNFDHCDYITGINIIDDMLFWTDGKSEPKKINITRSIEGTDSNGRNHTRLINPDQDIDYDSAILAREKDITVIRKAPKTPLTVEYETQPDYAFGRTRSSTEFWADDSIGAASGNMPANTDLVSIDIKLDDESLNIVSEGDVLLLNPDSASLPPPQEYIIELQLTKQVDTGSSASSSNLFWTTWLCEIINISQATPVSPQRYNWTQKIDEQKKFLDFLIDTNIKTESIQHTHHLPMLFLSQVSLCMMLKKHTILV